MRIKFKLPVKVYVWITTNQTGEICLQEFSTYNITSQSFEHHKFGEIVTSRTPELIALIKQFLQDNAKDQGININVLAEWGRWYSFSLLATFTTVLAASLFMYVGKVTAREIENYEEFKHSVVFNEIEEFSWRLWLLIRYGNASWGMFILNNTYTPALMYCETFDSNIPNDKVHEIKRSFTPFTTLFGVEDHNYLPFDYAIVYLGSNRTYEKIEQTIQLDKKRLQRYKEFALNKVLPVTKLSQDINFVKVLESGIYNQFIDMFSLSTVMTLESLEQIYTEGENNDVEQYIDTINSIRYLFYMLEQEPSEFIEKFISIFGEASHNKEKIGIVNSYSTKTGDNCIVIMKDESNKKYFYETIEKLKAEYPDIQVSYASRIDGISGDGVKMEQYISEKVFSNYTQKSKTFYKSNKGEAIFGNYDEFIQSQKEGLLLDTIDNKMYINGRKLTSNDLHSQTTTIHILEKCLDAPGKDISNEDFETSGYSKNKNEMTGKIILPLIELIQKETGEKLPIICKGSIFDFYIKLNPCTLKIAILKKI